MQPQQPQMLYPDAPQQQPYAEAAYYSSIVNPQPVSPQQQQQQFNNAYATPQAAYQPVPQQQPMQVHIVQQTGSAKQVQNNDDTIALLMLLLGFVFTNILFLVAWLMFRKSPNPRARTVASIAGVLFWVTMCAFVCSICISVGAVIIAVVVQIVTVASFAKSTNPNA